MARDSDPTTAAGRVFSGRPAVIGHRGLGKGVVDGHRENTVDSLLAALEAGVDWLELDVSRTSDDRLVVCHNPTTPDGAFLVEQTAAELSARGIPRLAEVLEAVPAQVPLNVDVKTVLEDAPLPPDHGTVGLLVPVLARERARRPLLVTSFDAAALLTLRDQVPGLPCGLLSWINFPLRIAVSAAAHLHFDVVGVQHGSFRANPAESAPVHREPAHSVRVAHESGLEVMAWCPVGDDARGLVEAGVDAVCVNDVPEMLPLVRGRSRQ